MDKKPGAFLSPCEIRKLKQDAADATRDGKKWLKQHKSTPVFIDIEASSLSEKSYPIEVAWSNNAGEITSILINPYGYPKEWTDWDPVAQKAHGLSRNYLSKHGMQPEVAASKIAQDLENLTIYSDAPEFDQFWINRLFACCHIQSHIKIMHVDNLLINMLPNNCSDGLGNGSIMFAGKLKEKARENTGLSRHRAARDVAYLVEVFRLAKRTKT